VFRNQLHSKFSFRFRRWSRKAYAVFASLGKSISIGSLSVDMAGATLFRSVELMKRIFSGEQVREELAEDEPAVVLAENSVVANLIISGQAVEYRAANNKYLVQLS
jgi:hypothetical protein